MALSPDATRPSPSDMKVICLGMSRTGTTSLKVALEILGLGPAYHGLDMISNRGLGIDTWFKIEEGKGTVADFDSLFEGCKSALDIPVALHGAELYAAYPDAKYILTTRDPIAWEKSMKETVISMYDKIFQIPVSERTKLVADLARWEELYLEKYFEGRMKTHTREVLETHNNRVKSIIPPEKLLIYNVGEGWDRLVDFLSVPTPDVPFPHLNDKESFNKKFGEPKEWK